MTKNIFDYISPDENDIFSKFNKLDLFKIMVCLNEYDLELRETLNIDDDVTFGFEIETEQANKRTIKKALKEKKLNKDWKLQHDYSLKKGVEVYSSILNDDKKTWTELREVCNILNSNSKIDLHSGAHIHVGSHAVGPDPQTWINLINLWITYENIIYRFGYGEYLTPRKTIIKYAYPVSKIFAQRLYFTKNSSAKQIIRRLSCDKYQGMNLGNIKNLNHELHKNTIEFRTPNGTLNPVIWQNNTNLFLHMINYCKRSDFDKEKVMSSRMSLEKYNLSNYNNIYLKQALEFSDLVFDNNLDKLYFLRQYLKKFEVYNNKVFMKATPFTKK